MVESVAAVIENKADIGSKERLRQALENIESVKRLDRTGEGKNYMVMGFHGRGEDLSRDNPQHGVWGAIITENSLGRQVLAEELNTYMHQKPRSLWPNAYIDISRFAAFYVKEGQFGVNPCLYPEDASRLVFTDPDVPGCLPPLVDLSRLLADRLRTVGVPDFPPSKYFALSKESVAALKLPSPEDS